MEELDLSQLGEERPSGGDEAQLKAILEAIIYVTDEPLSAQQIAAALGHPIDKIKRILDELIAESGRKNVVGKPILYKTTKEFLVQFGLKDLSELPTLKEFEELGRMEVVEPDPPPETKAASEHG